MNELNNFLNENKDIEELIPYDISIGMNLEELVMTFIVNGGNESMPYLRSFLVDKELLKYVIDNNINDFEDAIKKNQRRLDIMHVFRDFVRDNMEEEYQLLLTSLNLI